MMPRAAAIAPLYPSDGEKMLRGFDAGQIPLCGRRLRAWVRRSVKEIPIGQTPIRTLSRYVLTQTLTPLGLSR